MVCIALKLVLPSEAINRARNFFGEFLAGCEELGARNARNFIYITGFGLTKNRLSIDDFSQGARP